MDRYRWELDDQRRRMDAAGRRSVEIRSILGRSPGRKAGSARGWNGPGKKYVAYPWRVRQRTRAAGVGTVHLLDHAFAHLLGSVGRGVRKIATVHDLAPLRDATGLTPAQLRRFRRTVGHLHGADLVLADSRYSAAEAVEFLGLDPGKIRVLPLGVNVAAFSRRPTPPPGWAAPLEDRTVVLSLGMAVARKNLRILPAIFRALRERRGADDGLVLLRVGERLPPELAAALRGVLGAGGLVELGYLPNREVVAAYHCAHVLLLPSSQEGFGFPVLEAMAAGCPVVCTNVTSLPEIGGEAALYFGPDDPAARRRPPGCAVRRSRVTPTAGGSRTAARRGIFLGAALRASAGHLPRGGRRRERRLLNSGCNRAVRQGP